MLLNHSEIAETTYDGLTQQADTLESVLLSETPGSVSVSLPSLLTRVPDISVAVSVSFLKRKNNEINQIRAFFT